LVTIGSLSAALAALAISLVGASVAQASAADVASTQSYVRADYALVRYASGRIHSAEASLAGILSGVRHECPLAAAESPQDSESEQLSNEVIGTMVTTAIRPGLAQGRTFIRAAKPLHWSNRGLTHQIQTYVANLKTMSELAIPHLCADVKSWVASGYKTLPAATVGFDRLFMPAWVAIGLLPAGLSAYESGEVRTLAQRAARYENELTEFEARAVDTWGSIMDAMVLQP
jgi:hypothetical protein